MLKKYLQLTSIAVLLAFTLSSKAVDYTDHYEKGPSWALKGGAGLAMMGAPLNGQQVTNGATTTNLLETASSIAPAFYLSAQRAFVFNKTALYALSIGPSFYYTQFQSTGQGTASNANNYNYSFTTRQILALLEIQWTPIVLWRYFAPYVVLGAGMNMMTNTFSAVDLSTGIFPYPSSSQSSQSSFAADIGLGAEIMLNKHWGLDVRYIYLKSFGQTVTGISDAGALTLAGNTNVILLGLIWRFGLS